MGAELQAQVQSVLAGGVQTPSTTLTENTTLGSNSPALIGIGGTAARTITIEAPVAGGPGVGDDGKELQFVTVTAHAHIVVGPSLCLNGTDDTATSSAAAANFLTLKALGGVWYVVGNLNFTLSEA